MQSSRQIEEASLDQRRRHRFGFALGLSVRQARRHFLAIQSSYYRGVLSKLVHYPNESHELFHKASLNTNILKKKGFWVC